MREEFEEAEMAAVGDVEAQRERSVDEKVDIDPQDPFLVTWDGEDDPTNAINFAKRKKVTVMVMIAAIAFLTYSGYLQSNLIL
jgi:hypothetical protein